MSGPGARLDYSPLGGTSRILLAAIKRHVDASTQAARQEAASSTEHALPLLKKPLEQIGKQINVPGSYWYYKMFRGKGGEQ